MNLHPAKMNVSVRSTRCAAKGESFRCYSGFVLKSVLLFLAFMGVLVIHLYLRQQSVKSAERTVDLKKQIMDIRAETQNLRNHVAVLTGWPHISRKIREFNLGLGPAAPGQIIRTAVYTPKQAAAIPLTPLNIARRMGGR